MLKISTKVINSANSVTNFLKYKTFCTQTKKSIKWDLLSAICVERHPIITAPKSKIEEQFQTMLNEIELDGSMKSDHEIRIENENSEFLKKGKKQIDPDQVSVEKARDIEDRGDAELEKFTFAQRQTAADDNNDTTSLQRKLEKSLILVVQQKVGIGKFWLPPQGVREEGENMRQTAERALKATCGENINIKIYGNAPVGFYKYSYPRPMRENGLYGAKIFYYLGKYMDGEIPSNIKYQWLDRREMQNSLPKPVYKSVTKFLIPDHPED